MSKNDFMEELKGFLGKGRRGNGSQNKGTSVQDKGTSVQDEGKDEGKDDGVQPQKNKTKTYYYSIANAGEALVVGLLWYYYDLEDCERKSADKLEMDEILAKKAAFLSNPALWTREGLSAEQVLKDAVAFCQAEISEMQKELDENPKTKNDGYSRYCISEKRGFISDKKIEDYKKALQEVEELLSHEQTPNA